MNSIKYQREMHRYIQEHAIWKAEHGASWEVQRTLPAPANAADRIWRAPPPPVHPLDIENSKKYVAPMSRKLTVAAGAGPLVVAAIANPFHFSMWVFLGLAVVIDLLLMLVSKPFASNNQKSQYLPALLAFGVVSAAAFARLPLLWIFAIAVGAYFAWLRSKPFAAVDENVKGQAIGRLIVCSLAAFVLVGIVWKGMDVIAQPKLGWTYEAGHIDRPLRDSGFDQWPFLIPTLASLVLFVPHLLFALYGATRAALLLEVVKARAFNVDAAFWAREWSAQHGKPTDQASVIATLENGLPDDIRQLIDSARKEDSLSAEFVKSVGHGSVVSVKAVLSAYFVVNWVMTAFLLPALYAVTHASLLGDREKIGKQALNREYQRRQAAAEPQSSGLDIID